MLRGAGSARRLGGAVAVSGVRRASRHAFARLLLALGLAALLAGCAGFPRGAGLQREVLGTEASRSDPAKAPFAVAPVVRANLAQYARWPAVGEPSLPWIGRVKQPGNRIIAAGDTLAISLWSTENNGLLTANDQRFVTLQPVRVAADGTVVLPYAGSLRVAGMSVEHARARIEEAYVAVTPSAQVQLALTEGRLSTVSLVGGVASPGQYPLADRDVTVLELIAQGGGVPPGLENPQIRLQRGGRLYGTSMARLLARPELNTTLEGGDKIHVEADRRYFLSLGAAGREAQVRFPQDELTALDALSLIGGLSDARANARGILILRRYPEKSVGTPDGPPQPRMIFTIDLTSADGLFSAGQFRIRPGDLVYVTESALTGTRTVISLIGTAFGLANQAEAIGN